MATRPTQASKLSSHSREARVKRNERIYDALPPLGSPAYLSLIKSASAADLPPYVLARAYRKLYPSPAADATLERLLGDKAPDGYITVLHHMARRYVARLDAYSPEDLVCDTVGEIIATLAGPAGEGAERAWVHYLHQCMTWAYRKLVGRRGERVVVRAEAGLDTQRATRDPIDAADAAGGASIPWHGRVAPDILEWLEGFIECTVSRIADERVRAIARDLFSHAPLPISSDDPKDPNTLTGRFGVKRFTIYRWQRDARAILRAALERQNEREIDMSFLTSAG